MARTPRRKILVTGASGFIGRALLPALVERGSEVVAMSRRPVAPADAVAGVQWRTCDLLRPYTLSSVLDGVQVVYYLVHSMGGGHADFGRLDQRAARTLAAAAAKAGVQRIVYLGGPSPCGRASEHLRSRLEVGEILRGGTVPSLELRASMVIGSGSASWQIVRDLALRLPGMLLPTWLKSRTRPIALADVVTALVAAAELPLTHSDRFDVPGPEIMTGRHILERIAALRGRRILALEVPLLTPKLSALWLKLVTRTDFTLARELVLGLRQDLLPQDDRFWGLIGHTQLVPFDEAARRALASERRQPGLTEQLLRLEEKLVDLTAAWWPRR
jgi:uncharacterized protein YbjT (DUF2867 family)